MKSVQLNISGMKCGGCVQTVERILNDCEGTNNVSVNLLTESAYFDVNNNNLDINEILDNLSNSGFPSKIYTNDFAEKINKAELNKKQKWISKWKKLNFAFILLFVSVLGHLAEGGYINSSLLGNIYFHASIATTALLFPGRPIIIKGYKSFLLKRPDMDTLVALGVTSAYLTSLISIIFPESGFPCFFNEPVMLLGFILLGRFLEDRAKYQTGTSISELLDLQPEKTLIYKDNEDVKEIRVSALSPNDEIKVLAGDRVPADCIVLKGNSFVDVSHITGESKPIEAQEGDNLLNGSLNLNSSLRLKVIKVGSDTSLAKLVNLIESVQSQKPSIQRLADQIAGKFTYFVLFASISSFIFWWQIAFRLWPNLIKTGILDSSIHTNHSLHSSLGSNADNPLTLAIQLSIAVLVIACPCALGLATPTVITVASGKAAKKGILFKGGDKIEIASKIDSIIFDKTGTLTKGLPYVIGYIGSNDQTTLLQISASLESESRHPIAKSLIEEAKKQNLNLLPIKNINTETGRGISGELQSINGEIKVGNLQWLENQNVGINDEIKSQINSNEMKKYTIIGVSISFEVI